MIRKEFTYLSHDGDHEIHAVEWRPGTGLEIARGRKNGKPLAVLQIISGMCEYKERYDAFAAWLCRRGFVVVTHDQLGHGDTARSRGELGFFTSGNQSPADTLLADIHKLRLLTAMKYPDVPYFILGHSLGSYLLCNYLAHPEYGKMTRDEGDPGPLAGAVIMGSGYVSPVVSTGALLLTHLIAAVKGWHYRSGLIRTISTGTGPYKLYDTFGVDPARSWLSKDQEIVKAYHANPKSNFIFTLNGYRGLLESVLASCRKKNVRRIPKSLPLLMVSGSEDPVGNMGKGVRQMYSLFRHCGITRIKPRLFAGDRHEILNETDRLKVYKYLLQWMKTKIK